MDRRGWGHPIGWPPMVRGWTVQENHPNQTFKPNQPLDPRPRNVGFGPGRNRSTTRRGSSPLERITSGPSSACTGDSAGEPSSPDVLTPQRIRSVSVHVPRRMFRVFRFDVEVESCRIRCASRDISTWIGCLARASCGESTIERKDGTTSERSFRAHETLRRFG